MLKNECGVSQAWDPRLGGTEPAMSQFTGLWDTGATISAITQRVIDECGIVATGRAKVHGIGGEQEVDTYLINIALPNKVLVTGIRVITGTIHDADLLIGMDVISQGDFAVTNFNGITRFTFRVPSKLHIDFATEIAKENKIPKFTHGDKKARRKGKR